MVHHIHRQKIVKGLGYQKNNNAFIVLVVASVEKWSKMKFSEENVLNNVTQMLRSWE